jgi:hypothetical protein
MEQQALWCVAVARASRVGSIIPQVRSRDDIRPLIRLIQGAISSRLAIAVLLQSYTVQSSWKMQCWLDPFMTANFNSLGQESRGGDEFVRDGLGHAI